MAEQKPPERPAQQPEPKEQPKPADPPKPAPKVVLGSAGASSNPLVHQLLAERAIMSSAGDKDAVKALDGRLADLGVSVE